MTGQPPRIDLDQVVPSPLPGHLRRIVDEELDAIAPGLDAVTVWRLERLVELAYADGWAGGHGRGYHVGVREERQRAAATIRGALAEMPPEPRAEHDPDPAPAGPAMSMLEGPTSWIEK